MNIKMKQKHNRVNKIKQIPVKIVQPFNKKESAMH